MKKEPKDNNLSKLVLNCIIYLFIGIYYDYFLICNILFVRGITGAELTDWSRIVSIVLIIALGAIPAGMLISFESCGAIHCENSSTIFLL